MQYSQFWPLFTTGNLLTRKYAVSPHSTFCETALPCKTWLQLYLQCAMAMDCSNESVTITVQWRDRLQTFVKHRGSLEFVLGADNRSRRRKR